MVSLVEKLTHLFLTTLVFIFLEKQNKNKTRENTKVKKASENNYIATGLFSLILGKRIHLHKSIYLYIYILFFKILKWIEDGFGTKSIPYLYLYIYI